MPRITWIARVWIMISTTLVLVTMPAVVARGGPPLEASHGLAAATDASRTCADRARAKAAKNKKYKYWVCLGAKAKYFKKQRAVVPADRGGSAAPRPTSGARPQAGSGRSEEAKIFDVDDSRCELVPECTTMRTLYAADIKANALYGFGKEIWGSLDVIFAQSFNGGSSRYRVKLIWDYGYPVDSQYWIAQVRREITLLPDPVTGSVSFFPSRISSAAWTSARPSLTGFSPTEATVFTGRHHDDLYGSFEANGQPFGTTTLHLPDFFCPDHRCRYYGPTGPS